MSTESSYFDLQVNGFYGVDFQRPDLTAEQLHLACEKLAEGGVGGILATVITEKLELMCASLARLAELRERDSLAQQVIAGLHIEGPFINEVDGYRGAHPRDAVRIADSDSMSRLLEAAGGLARIVTLAPERDPALRVTRMLVRQDIIASAGHCNPTLDELDAAIDAGLTMFTHLGNGCPMLLHRHDNIIQRVFARADRLWLTFIGDGAHIPYFALGNYLRCASPERCCILTDAIAPAGLGPGAYTLGRWNVVVGEDLVAMAPDRSHFIGAAITMRQTEVNLLRQLHLAPDTVRQLLCGNPRKAVGLA